jgi:hypothetical protein
MEIADNVAICETDNPKSSFRKIGIATEVKPRAPCTKYTRPNNK